jgi:CTP:molybdopterin cytidylyltransferase MocA
MKLQTSLKENYTVYENLLSRYGKKYILKRYMTSIVIIPARYDSTRFPGKPLYPLRGMPVIQHVRKRKTCCFADEVIVATDSETIFERVPAFWRQSGDDG